MRRVPDIAGLCTAPGQQLVSGVAHIFREIFQQELPCASSGSWGLRLQPLPQLNWYGDAI
jgi:hypothetical protein